jgi:hypothetical protein
MSAAILTPALRDNELADGAQRDVFEQVITTSVRP